MSDAKRDRAGYPKGATPPASQPEPPATAADPVPVPLAPPAEVPAPVIRRHRLTHAHGFIDENDRHRHWRAGDVLSDPAEIAMLQARGVPIVPME